MAVGKRDSHGYSVTGSAAELIERMGFGFAQFKILLAGGGSKLADGSELLLLGSVTRVLAGEWHLTWGQRGFVVSVVFIGVLFGNLLGGVLGDKVGRRFPILISYVGICTFSLLSVLATGFASIAFIRFWVGVSFGVSGPAVNTLFAELTPSDCRMQMSAWGMLLFSFGEFYSALLIWWQDPFMVDLSWRWLICMGAIPSIVFLAFAVLLPIESPSFLLVNGRRDEAQRVLEDIRNANFAMDVDINLAESYVVTPQRGTIRDKLGIVMGRHLMYTTVVACLSMFTLNFLFCGGLYAFPQVLPRLKLHVSPAANLMMGALAEVPGYMAGVFIGNYLSRKTCMLVYLLTVLTSTLTFSIAGMQVADNGLEQGLEVLLQLGLAGIKIFTAVGFLVVFVYVSEVYPTVARSTGGALCIAVGRLGSIVAPTAFENLKHLTGGHAAFFNLTAGLCAVNAMLVLFLPYETKDLVLQDHLDEGQPLCVQTIGRKKSVRNYREEP